MILTDDEVRQLGERGFFVRDGFVDVETIRAARAELERLPLRPAGLRREGHLAPDERGDRIVWLDRASAPPALAQLCDRLNALRGALTRDAWLPVARCDIQAAQYPGGGARYVRHRDAFPGSDNRRATAIVYLNDGWRPEHGGQLRLHTDPAVDIEPLAGRLVVFLSARVEHEVLPAFAPRSAVTAWYYHQ